MRRLGPRPLAVALAEVAPAVAPQTLLARVQSAWPEVAGAAMAASATPVAEREGVVTVACKSAVWAQELELLAADLLGRLNTALGARGAPALTRLRFVVGSAPNSASPDPTSRRS
jgi:predicted nucleic acid-binding Zn ribbon protein